MNPIVTTRESVESIFKKKYHIPFKKRFKISLTVSLNSNSKKER